MSYAIGLRSALYGAGGWTPLRLFRNGEQGAWYDPSDLSTLFQDAAGTTPVAADGDPVGLMLDKSGNGNHASQSVAASRPTFREGGGLRWLEFDGVDDWLRSSLSIQNEDELAISVAHRDYVTGCFYSSRSSRGPLQRDSAAWLHDFYASLSLSTPQRFSNNQVSVIDGSLSPFSFYASQNGNVTGTVTVQNISVLFLDLETGGTCIGARGASSEFLSAKIHSMVLLCRRFFSGNERAKMESYLAEKSGVTL